MSNRGSQRNSSHANKAGDNKAGKGSVRRRDLDVDESDEAEAAEYFPGDVSEEIFWNVADSFIELANNQNDSVPAETVNAALMYAAARYSAFVAVNQHAQDSELGTGGSADEPVEADTVAQYYALQFRKLFDENLSQYIDTPDAEGSPDSVDQSRDESSD